LPCHKEAEAGYAVEQPTTRNTCVLEAFTGEGFVSSINKYNFLKKIDIRPLQGEPPKK
jgi:hypothetical protein